MNKLRLVLLMLILTFSFSFNVFAADVTTTNSSSVTNTWTYCASENGYCSFSGQKQVRFGANGSYFYKIFNNGTACNNSVFGDPIYGTVKACYFLETDTTPPNTTDNAPTNWVNKDVTVTLKATDSDSGVATTYYTVDGGAQQTGTTVNITTEGKHAFTYWSVDKAGNVEAQHTATVQIDKTAPIITGAPTTAANANGWYNGDVTVHFSCSDSGSGVANCSQDTTISTEGANQSVQGTATDNSGNSASTTVGGINIDKTAPNTTDNAPTNWVNKGVTVTLTATDSGSGVVSTYYTVDGGAQQTGTNVIVTNEGIHTIAYWSVDFAGNTEKQHNVTVKIDKTAPTLAVTANGAPLTNGMEFQDSHLITLAMQATDNLSGVAEQTITVDGKSYVAGTTLDWAGQLGIHVVQITVKDVAGNVSQSVSNVNLKTSISTMEQLVERYSASGDLKGSLKKELLEALKDAQENLRDGDIKDAIGAMKDFQKKISKPNKESYISDRAKTVLVTDANALIQIWSLVNVSDRDHNNKSDEPNNKVNNQRNGDNASK